MVATVVFGDELRNAEGTLVGPLGFGDSGDWERLERREITSAVATSDFFFDQTKYDAIRFVCINLTIDGLNGQIEGRTSNDGSTFDSTAGDYEYIFAEWLNNGLGTNGHFIVAGNSNTEMRMVGGLGNTSGDAFSGNIVIWGPDDAAVNTFVQTDGVMFTGNSPTKGAARVMSQGVRQANEIVNGFQFRAAGAASNIDGGVIIMEGRKKVASSFNNQDDWVVIEDRTGISASANEDFFWDDQLYDEIEVSIEGLVPGTDDRDVYMRMSKDGSTFDSGASDYALTHENTSTSSQAYSTGSAGAAQVTLALALGNTSPEDADLDIHFKNVSGTTGRRKGHFKAVGLLNDGTLQTFQGGFAQIIDEDSLRGFQILMESAATFSADRIRVRGRRLTPTGVLKQDWEVLSTWDHADTGDLAEIEFTDIPSSEFDEFELTLKDMNTGTTPNTLVLQFSDDNGATWATGAVYQYNLTNRSAEAAYAETRDAAATYIALTANFGAGNERVANTIIWFSPLDGTSDRGIRFHSQAVNDSDNLRQQSGGGRWEGHTGTTTAFRLDLSAGGNFTGGRAVLRGRRKQPV